MGILSTGGMGLDLGSANVTICLQNEGVVLREPSYVLSMRDSTEDVLAVGRDARQMLGRTPGNISAVRPSICCASLPTLRMRSVLVSIATTEGSCSTIPLPCIYTSTVAVPRSMPMLRLN